MDLRYEIVAVKHFKANFLNPRGLLWILLSSALGAATVLIAGPRLLKPQHEQALRHVRAHEAMFKLYDLQMNLEATRGRFARDLDSLLATTKEGPQIRERLAANVDMATLAVVVQKDGKRFKLEANVLDEQRTLITIRGPLRFIEPPASTP